MPRNKRKQVYEEGHTCSDGGIGKSLMRKLKEANISHDNLEVEEEKSAFMGKPVRRQSWAVKKNLEMLYPALPSPNLKISLERYATKEDKQNVPSSLKGLAAYHEEHSLDHHEFLAYLLPNSP